MTGMREEDLLESAREPALHQLRITLALEAIIKEENLAASEEEIEAEYQKMADQYNMKLEDVKKYLRSADVEEQIKREKALDIIVESATVKEPEAKDEAQAE
jgi:trigger factor